MEYDDAISRVEAFITGLLPPEERKAGIKVKIYDYFGGEPAMLRNRPWCGVRVAEVSFSYASRGYSYMQVDAPWGIAMCGQAERCILAEIEDWDAEYPGEIANEYDRLRYLFELQIDDSTH